MNVVHLEVTYPDGRYESLVVDAERVLIGSGAHCDLRLPTDLAKSEHVAIEIVGETVRVEALADDPAPTLDGNVVRRAAVSPGQVLGIGALQVRVTPTAAFEDAERVRKRRSASGSTLVRALGLVAMAILGAVALSLDDEAAGRPPQDAPALFASAVAECPVKAKEQAGAMASDKRIAADGRRERHPFYVSEGVEAVNLYEQASACFRVGGETGLADELAGVARQLRTDVVDDARVRRLRLERALASGDRDVGAREVVALRALFIGKKGPYVEWLNGVARRLDVDKESK